MSKASVREKMELPTAAWHGPVFVVGIDIFHAGIAILLTEGIRKNTSHIPIFIEKKTKLVWPMISHTVSSISPFWCFFVDPNHEADNHPEFSNLRETQAQEDRGATCIEQILVDHEGSIKLIPKFSASRHVLRNDKRKGMSGECS